ncbi:MAG: MBL fold metallo-hydrolase [Leptospiraceae bacterium]|jgi:glyoxylase-like metal-dependent hydrolase (beta-lactamase superfamily II)|nr:MBL fold metallo-hydrolase [Leptospiraceae bacterium]
MEVKEFFDNRTFTLTYIIWDKNTKDGVIIDSVLDYEPIGSRVWPESLNSYIDFIKLNAINLKFILETHAHADHLSAAPYLKKHFPQACIGIGENIISIQDYFKKVFSLEVLKADGSQFDYLLQDNQIIKAGSLEIKVIHTPGHTPACVCYLIEDKLFTGDLLFMPDYGTGRCDFPKGDSHALYHSVIDKIYSLPDSTKIYTGHDYMPNGRPMKFTTTVGDSKKNNIQLPKDRSEEDFVKFRETRDSNLAAPKLLYQSVISNINGGGLPPLQEKGKNYFKIPINIHDPGHLL